MENARHSALLARLTSDNPDVVAAAAESTWDLETLAEAWAFWNEKALSRPDIEASLPPTHERRNPDADRERANAISYRMNQIRGS